MAPDNLKLEVAKNAIASVTTQDESSDSSRPSAGFAVWSIEKRNMKKNLKNKVALIIAVLVVCLYGIFGVPAGLTGKDLMDAMSKRIHLGLDLRGGAHLILQVHVQDAVNDETNNTVQEIEQDLKKGNLTYSQVFKPDPQKPEIIRIAGVPPAQSGAVSTLLDGDKYSGEYDVSQGTDNSLTVTMKPIFERDLDSRTDEEAIETISDRVNSLGVREPQIQEYGLGANQILVELPGISDLDQVKTIIQSTARLEIHAVEGGPFPDQQAALASVSNMLPPEEEILPASGELAGGGGGDSCYILAAHGHRGRQRLPLRRRRASTKTRGKEPWTLRSPTKPATSSGTTPAPM